MQKLNRSNSGVVVKADRNIKPIVGVSPNNLVYRAMNGAIDFLINLVCEIDSAQVEKVPDKGPLILFANHVNFLEIPIMYLALRPRPVAAFVKHEHWMNLLMRFLLAMWGGIPLRRGEADLKALRRGIEVLDSGYILAIAPEGTRSGHGRLQPAHSGGIFMALKSGAPIQPAVYYGHENFWENARRLKRSEIHIAVGRPFWLDAGSERVTQQVRDQMLEEVMYQMAGLLPETYRGVYADLSQGTEKYLRFSE